MIVIYKCHSISLTDQEYKCLELLGRGKKPKEIGLLLNISYRTVENYLNQIKKKTNINYNSGLIDFFHDISSQAKRYIFDEIRDYMIQNNIFQLIFENHEGFSITEIKKEKL